jgi:hypothetical protein
MPFLPPGQNAFWLVRFQAFEARERGGILPAARVRSFTDAHLEGLARRMRLSEDIETLPLQVPRELQIIEVVGSLCCHETSLRVRRCARDVPFRLQIRLCASRGSPLRTAARLGEVANLRHARNVVRVLGRCASGIADFARGQVHHSLNGWASSSLGSSTGTSKNCCRPPTSPMPLAMEVTVVMTIVPTWRDRLAGNNDTRNRDSHSGNSDGGGGRCCLDQCSRDAGTNPPAPSMSFRAVGRPDHDHQSKRRQFELSPDCHSTPRTSIGRGEWPRPVRSNT